MSTVHVKNFGCRLNALEGDAIGAAAQAAGLTHTTIINSCAVTQEAVRQTRKAIRQEKRKNPAHKIFVTGCAAQIETEDFAAMNETDRVIGNHEKVKTTSYQEDAAPVIVGDIMHQREIAAVRPPKQEQRARAFVQIQAGCDHRCTFCIIPFGRGNSRSRAQADIVAQCRTLVEQGHKEIVLTGVDITSWGTDNGAGDISDLIRTLLREVPDLPRMRLSSVDAIELPLALCDIMGEESRLMPHLHLSLQSGDDMILKRMKRRHSRADAIDLCTRLRKKRPDILFGADLIAGFPTESAEMFENSRRLIHECDIRWLHIFPFSPRPGTPAARMPQVSPQAIKHRAALLRAEGAKQRKKWFSTQIGKTISALAETPTHARAENFALIQSATPLQAGEMVKLQITGYDEAVLLGEVC